MNFKRWSFAKKKTKQIGRAGENAAARLLVRKGCQILVRNCHTPRAELDIVALDGNTLVFAEVKTLYRHKGKNGELKELRPQHNLRLEQKKRIWRGAYAYLKELNQPKIPIRFDIVEVILNR